MSDDHAPNPYEPPAGDDVFVGSSDHVTSGRRAPHEESIVRAIGIATLLAAAEHILAAVFISSIRRALPAGSMKVTIANGLSLGAFVSAVGLGIAGQRLRQLDERGVDLLRNVLVVDLLCAIGQCVLVGASARGMIITWAVRLALGVACWRYVSRGPGSRVLTHSYQRAHLDPNDTTTAWRWVGILLVLMLAGYFFGGCVTGAAANL